MVPVLPTKVRHGGGLWTGLGQHLARYWRESVNVRVQPDQPALPMPMYRIGFSKHLAGELYRLMTVIDGFSDYPIRYWHPSKAELECFRFALGVIAQFSIILTCRQFNPLRPKLLERLDALAPIFLVAGRAVRRDDAVGCHPASILGRPQLNDGRS